MGRQLRDNSTVQKLVLVVAVKKKEKRWKSLDDVSLALVGVWRECPFSACYDWWFLVPTSATPALWCGAGQAPLTCWGIWSSIN